jgi:hypothetical protein
VTNLVTNQTHKGHPLIKPCLFPLVRINTAQHLHLNIMNACSHQHSTTPTPEHHEASQPTVCEVLAVEAQHCSPRRCHSPAHPPTHHSSFALIHSIHSSTAPPLRTKNNNVFKGGLYHLALRLDPHVTAHSPQKATRLTMREVLAFEAQHCSTNALDATRQPNHPIIAATASSSRSLHTEGVAPAADAFGWQLHDWMRQLGPDSEVRVVCSSSSNSKRYTCRSERP